MFIDFKVRTPFVYACLSSLCVFFSLEKSRPKNFNSGFVYLKSDKYSKLKGKKTMIRKNKN